MYHQIYGSAGGAFATKKVDWVTDPIYVGLLRTDYYPDVQDHTTWADVSPFEIFEGGGYTLGGKALTGRAVQFDVGTYNTLLKADTLIWTASSFTAQYGVVYLNSGTKPLLSYIDFQTEITTLNNDFIFQWSYGTVISIRIG